MLRLTLELDPAASPLRGWVVREDEDREAFTGMLELLSALEAAVAGSGPHEARP